MVVLVVVVIEKLTLENFRGVKKGEIELAPLTILLGPNNAGKTTILEALFLLPNPLRDVPYFIPNYGARFSPVVVLNAIHETLDSRGYAFLLHKYVAKKSLIECEIGQNKYRLELVTKKPWIALTTDQKTQARLALPEVGQVYWYGQMHMETLQLEIHDSDTIVVGESLFLAPRLVKMAYEYLRKNWSSIINLGITKKVAEEASLLSSESYSDFTMEPFIGGLLTFYAFLEGGWRVRIGDIGEGMQSYIVSKILYEIVKPQFLLWDDIDAHLNPRILVRIASWIGDLLREGRQVVVSTHSLEAAKILAGLNEDSAKIYLMLLDDGVLKTKPLTLQEIKELSAAGIDVRVGEQLLL